MNLTGRQCFYGVLLFMMTTAANAQTVLHCNRQIVAEGALTVDVLRLCGEPKSRDSQPPARRADGHVRRDAVTVETWVYGPRNGVYRYLRFIDGKLVKIWSKPK